MSDEWVINENLSLWEKKIMGYLRLMESYYLTLWCQTWLENPRKNREVFAGKFSRNCWGILHATDYQRVPIEEQRHTHWIGLRENLQETMVFTIKYRSFL